MVFLKNNFFSVTILVLLLLMTATGYYRFVLITDYTVSYQGDCDPLVASCFVGCEDDDCTETYYYAIIERPATEILNLCGEDITNCDAAYSCPKGLAACVVTFCDPLIEDGDECFTVAETTL